MCGGCNVLAESAGVSVIVARAWWVSRQARRTVAEAESVLAGVALDVPTIDGFDDPLPAVSRVL